VLKVVIQCCSLWKLLRSVPGEQAPTDFYLSTCLSFPTLTSGRSISLVRAGPYNPPAQRSSSSGLDIHIFWSFKPDLLITVRIFD